MSSRFTFRLPPQAELLFKQALIEVGKVGAKAAAAGAKSLMGDVRRRVKDVDQFLARAEKVAKERAKEDE